VEIDDQGRPVHRPRPPGHVDPEDLPDAWPQLQHSPWTLEGRMEQVGVLARGLRRRGGSRRAAPLLVALVAVPFLLVLLGSLWVIVVD
jgi:hypothetical protein